MRMHSFFEIFKNDIDFSINSHKNADSRYGDEASKVHEYVLDFYNGLYERKDSIVQIDVSDFLERLSEEEFKDLANYSAELKKNKLLISPYSFISISFKYNKEGILFVQEYKDDVLIFLAFKTKLPTIENVLLIKVDFDDEKQIMIETDWLCPFIGEKDVDNELRGVYSKLAIQVFLIVCSITQSKNCELISIPEPKRLNEKRIKKGRPPIGEIKEIRINYNGKKYLASGCEEGGTHASPRLHWRRGHIRRLLDGKITNVRPSLVGEIKSQEPKMPSYKIVRGKQNA